MRLSAVCLQKETKPRRAYLSLKINKDIQFLSMSKITISVSYFNLLQVANFFSFPSQGI
jgi:hypothetical protein